MTLRKRRGQTYRLYSVSYYTPGPFGFGRQDVIFLAIPRLMRMLSVSEIASAIAQAYGDPTADIEVLSVSSLGEFKRDALPAQECIIMSRKSRPVGPFSNSKDMVTTHDGLPVMVRMDWKV